MMLHSMPEVFWIETSKEKQQGRVIWMGLTIECCRQTLFSVLRMDSYSHEGVRHELFWIGQGQRYVLCSVLTIAARCSDFRRLALEVGAFRIVVEVGQELCSRVSFFMWLERSNDMFGTGSPGWFSNICLKICYVQSCDDNFSLNYPLLRSNCSFDNSPVNCCYVFASPVRTDSG